MNHINNLARQLAASMPSDKRLTPQDWAQIDEVLNQASNETLVFISKMKNTCVWFNAKIILHKRQLQKSNN